MRPISRTTLRCLVCGSSEVLTDEVIDRGLVLLAECRRCRHRWTRAEPALRSAAVVDAPIEQLPAA